MIRFHVEHSFLTLPQVNFVTKKNTIFIVLTLFRNFSTLPTPKLSKLFGLICFFSWPRIIGLCLWIQPYTYSLRHFSMAGDKRPPPWLYIDSDPLPFTPEHSWMFSSLRYQYVKSDHLKSTCSICLMEKIKNV